MNATSKYIDFSKELETTVLKNKYEIIKLLKKEVDNYEKYYLTNTMYDNRKVFSESNVDLIVGALNYKPQDFIKTIKTFSNPNWNVLNDKANISLLIISYALEHNNFDKDLKVVTLHLCHRFFSGLLLKYFPYGIKEEVFKYTLNRISNKFMVRAYNGNINSITNFIAEDHITKFSSYLESKTDDKFILYILYLRTRINTIIGNFAKEYYKFDKEGFKMSANVTITDESGEDISSFSNDTSVILGLKTKLIDRVNSFKSIKIHEAISSHIGTENTRELLDKMYINCFKEQFVSEFSEAFIALLFNKKFNSNICLNDTRKLIVVEFDRKTSTNKVRMLLDEIVESTSIELDVNPNENNKKIVRTYIILSYLLYLRQIMCKG